MAVAQAFARAGRTLDATEWYAKAERLYPVAQYRAKARDARLALGQVSGPMRSPSLQKSDPQTLHVIECSWTKAWSSNPKALRFLPARDAYQGKAIQAWLQDPRSRSERWLILSARYGFIDPDQPIENYNVSFSDAASGPISIDTLAAQVAHQVRWADSMPLNTFRRIVVHGGDKYLRRVRDAFANADVVSQSTIDVPTVPDPDVVVRFDWSRDRASAIGKSLCEVPSRVFENFDRNEPEWPVVQLLAAWDDERLAVLAALCLGFSDYQLGQGGAEAYWVAVENELKAKPVAHAYDVIGLLTRTCKHSVSARLAEQKLTRVRRVVDRWSALVPIEPVSLWHWVADSLQQDPEKKTVVMAMKLVDLLHRAKHGAYMDLTPTFPLPVDLRVARLSITSGLLRQSDGTAIDHRNVDVNEIASTHLEMIVEAWRAVAQHARGISLLRIDSLAWQLAEHLKTPDAFGAIRDHLIRAKCRSEVAERVASELTLHCT